MRTPFHTPFAAVFQNEVLLNSKRVAPYAMALVCAGNGLLWWGWGPATGRGWAVNADFFIAGALPVYSFMTLPLFTAMFMADPVSRDFRGGIDALIFSKPFSRAAYLLGKFFGNFFVLVCCQAAFVLTWFVLQGVHKPGVVTQDLKVVPYIKHFFVFVVISHLFIAAFYFAVGAITRSSKIVYGLGISFYPIYIAYQVLLGNLPWRWKIALDPLVMNRGNAHRYNLSVEALNQLVITYDADLIVNRVVLILLTAVCLLIVYLRFSIEEKSDRVPFSVLNLSTRVAGLDSGFGQSASADSSAGLYFHERAQRTLPLPQVTLAESSFGANVRKLRAALAIEFQLLRAEKSLLVLAPLTVLLSFIALPFSVTALGLSYSAAYAGETAASLAMFFTGVVVFYVGEAMHRDAETKVEPILWAEPISNSVLLLSKLLATLSVSGTLVVIMAITTMIVQLLRSQTPIQLVPYLLTYSVILLPSIIFAAGVSLFLNVLLRNKYLVYVVTIGAATTMFYLYSLGHTHWLYNPLLIRLWSYSDLVSGGSLTRILGYRLYLLTLSLLFILFAHYLYPRPGSSRAS